MSYQRRRNALPCTLYPLKRVTDSRGNQLDAVDFDDPWVTKAWIYPQRGAKAEVKGQQQIEVVRIGVEDNERARALHLGSRVEFMGGEWDVVTPPSFHNGIKRHTRHFSFDIRRRP